MLLQAYIDETGFGPAGDDFGVAYAPSNVLTYAFLSHDMTCFSCVEYVSFLLLVIQNFLELHVCSLSAQTSRFSMRSLMMTWLASLMQ